MPLPLETPSLLLLRASAPASHIQCRSLTEKRGRAVLRGEKTSTSQVVAYDKFLQTHGQTGGWDERDHSKFKKLLDKSGRDYSRVVEAAVVEFAGLYDRREVIQHARWDAEHEDLLLRKRDAIARWRAAKEAERAAVRPARVSPFCRSLRPRQSARRPSVRRGCGLASVTQKTAWGKSFSPLILSQRVDQLVSESAKASAEERVAAAAARRRERVEREEALAEWCGSGGQ